MFVNVKKMKSRGLVCIITVRQKRTITHLFTPDEKIFGPRNNFNKAFLMVENYRDLCCVDVLAC
jgi:hypothetical protein